MTAKETVDWYTSSGWQKINEWLCQLAAKNYNRAYLGNLEVIPENADKQALISIFNEGSLWHLELDDEGDYLCTRKEYSAH